MEGLTDQSSLNESNETHWRPILVGIALVVIVVGIIAWLSRNEPRTVTGPPPYAANLKISNVKMSTAENFVGASVTYIEGKVTNNGDKTVTHVVTQVTFKDSMGQVVQADTIPLYVIDSSGPYPNPVDLSASPLAPSQAKPFRITFEHVSADWSGQYPTLEIADVSVKEK
jgi:hypothetical protein